jgi:hypothetical protein
VEQERGDLCLNILEFLSDFLDLRQADFFIATDAGRLHASAGFPAIPTVSTSRSFTREDGQDGSGGLGKNHIIFSKGPGQRAGDARSDSRPANLIAVPLRVAANGQRGSGAGKNRMDSANLTAIS